MGTMKASRLHIIGIGNTGTYHTLEYLYASRSFKNLIRQDIQLNILMDYFKF